MRRIFSRTRSIAPFLFSERGSIQLTRSLRRSGGGATEFSDEKDQWGLELVGNHAGADLQQTRLSDCRGANVRFDAINAVGTTWRRSLFPGSRWTNLQASGSWWEVVDLEGAGLAASALAGSRFELVAFRDGELQDLDLSGCTFILCDFSGARFRRVNLRKAQFVGCDFDGAVFEEDVDLSDADLTANNLRRCWLGGANLAGARVLHADCRGALGLLANSPLAAKLREGGALLGGSRLGAFWQKVLGHEGTAHKRVLAAVSLTWAITAVAIPLIFFGRAIMNPVNPDNLPEPPQESAEEEPDPAPEESHQD